MILAHLEWTADLYGEGRLSLLGVPVSIVASSYLIYLPENLYIACWASALFSAVGHIWCLKCVYILSFNTIRPVFFKKKRKESRPGILCIQEEWNIIQ